MRNRRKAPVLVEPIRVAGSALPLLRKCSYPNILSEVVRLKPPIHHKAAPRTGKLDCNLSDGSNWVLLFSQWKKIQQESSANCGRIIAIDSEIQNYLSLVAVCVRGKVNSYRRVWGLILTDRKRFLGASTEMLHISLLHPQLAYLIMSSSWYQMERFGKIQH